MRMRQFIALITLTIIIISGSCVSRKKLTYLQYSGKSADYTNDQAIEKTSVTPSVYRIMPYDNLYIRVVTPDPQWSTLFNADIGTAGITQESAALSGYSVDVNGFIEIPYVGRVNVGGKTLSEIKSQLDSIFRNYVTDAAIMVRLVNNYVSIIGEVNSPGRYILTKDRINIFEALSMAGDMSNYSNRQKVQLIRPSPYGPVIKEVSLSDRSIMSSEYYYIMPNDIIYVMPLQSRSFQANSSVWTLFLTTITSALGIIAFFRTL
jgi:polysaccharide export outer membrane protein